MKSVKLQAHRGVSTDYPENTMSAFVGAICQGYEIIELDPDVTADNQIVILHDGTLNRTGRKSGGQQLTETLSIHDITYEEALTYDVGLWFSNKYKGEKIPLLSQVLELAAKNDVLIKIDSKFQRFCESVMEDLFQMVKESGARVAFTCNNVEFIRLVQDNVPEAEIHYDGPVTRESLQEISSIVDKEKLVVWLPYKSELTSWVTVPFADRKLATLVKDYARLGIWILSEYEQFDDAVENLGADIIETTGKIKPIKRTGFKTDIHMHSEFSHDSIAPVSEMFASARDKGVDVICITDHCDLYGSDETIHLENSAKAAKSANETFGPKPEVLAGVEIGEGFWRPDMCQNVIHLALYDEIIGSVHVVRYGEPVMAYSRIDFSTYDDAQIDAFLNQYFDDVLCLVRESECDVLAHLTSPLKYICGKYGKAVDWTRYKEKIIKILEFIIRHGIALEINTSTKGSRYDEFMPNEEIIKMYAEMGGYLVTMGADAHVPNNVFRHADEVVAVLKKYGFRNLFYFKNRYIYQYTIAE